ncbi:beta-agarase [Flammeovirga sp. MY04]|uniref:beta-galactosidase n=1 Tax=Flammeovirga sp. MY04 TaxID=1191459 RepID=UPI00076F3060
MRKKANKLTWLIGVITIGTLFFLAFNPPKSIDEHSLIDFSSEEISNQIKAKDATFELKNNTLIVRNGFTKQESGVVIYESNNHPWNLEGMYTIEAEVENLGEEYIQVEMFVGDNVDEKGLIRWYCSDYVDLEPGESGKIIVPLAWSPWVFDPQPQYYPGMRGMFGMLKRDVTTIKEITFNSRYSYKENTFAVKKLSAKQLLKKRKPDNVIPFVDQYGQSKYTDWKGKIHSDRELNQSITNEEKDYLAHQEAPSRSKFGGHIGYENFEAKGHFYTKKHQGKWWLVDPEGHLFWSSGLNCVNNHSMSTGITGREELFSYLPKGDDPLKKFYSTSKWKPLGFYQQFDEYETFNFYQANLYRKYGDQWKNKFAELANKRIKSWGMNTIGFVSDKQTIESHKNPYVGSVWIRDTQKIEGSNGYWGKFHDVFAKDFKSKVKESVADQSLGANDPWCIGYFVDNEMSWGNIGSLAIATLKSPESQPAKKEFISDLKQKYKKIEKLNKQWATNYASWKALSKNTNPKLGDGANEDVYAFYQKIAITYFKTIHDELAKVAPNQLYLGCRFAWGNNAIVMKSAAQYCDILSFNKYEYSVKHVSLPEDVDMPILIGEFHFGAIDRGSFHPGVKVAKDQNDRGEKYISYIQSALNHPNIIGAHWFQYTDQPLTGRGDGENYNVGLVDVTDQPYQEVVDKFREINYQLYDYRLGNVNN